MTTGDSTNFTLKFLKANEQCSIGLIRDIQPLLQPKGWLTTSLFEWFRLWLYAQFPLINYVLFSPCLYISLKKHVKERKSSYYSLQNFLKEHNIGKEEHTVLMPLVDGGHWSLFIMTNCAEFFHLDSLLSTQLHDKPSFYRLLGKVWCVHLGVQDGDNPWNRAVDKRA